MARALSRISGRLLCFVLLAVLASCSTSYKVRYEPHRGVDVGAPALAGTRIGVLRPADARQWTQTFGTQAESWLFNQDGLTFGVTYDGREFTPIPELVQALLVKELRAAGVDAVAVDAAPNETDAAAIMSAGRTSKSDWLIGGRVLMFQFNYEKRMFSCLACRSATLEVWILRPEHGIVLLRRTYSFSDQEEGGGLGFHEENTYKLLNVVFRRVADEVVNEVIRAVASDRGK